MMRRKGDIFGDRTDRAIRRMVSGDRLRMFHKAIDYINYELVEGDILEFGVFTGRTLAALTHLQKTSQYETPFLRIVQGFDSFEGLPVSSNTHPRWEQDNCATNHLDDTPTVEHDGLVAARSVLELFDRLELPTPDLHTGLFNVTIPQVIPARCTAAALVHIDCDIYESARDVLFGVEPVLQDGTIVLFDDWFHYRGNPTMGEQRAFAEFLEAFPRWTAVDYGNYAIFCKAFILSRKD